MIVAPIPRDELMEYLHARIDFYTQKSNSGSVNYTDYVDAFQMIYRHYFGANYKPQVKQEQRDYSQYRINH
jgi:hypothetical protein